MPLVAAFNSFLLIPMANPDLNWQICTFDELSNDALYRLLQLRSEVFVVEQNIVYQDLDEVDRKAIHVQGFSGNELICYARLLPPGCRYPGPAIGRIITRKEFRKQGFGSQLVNRSIACCKQHWSDLPITISAQQHLEQFYTALAFTTISAPYDEEGIPHIRMVHE